LIQFGFIFDAFFFIGDVAQTASIANRETRVIHTLRGCVQRYMLDFCSNDFSRFCAEKRRLKSSL